MSSFAPITPRTSQSYSLSQSHSPHAVSAKPLGISKSSDSEALALSTPGVHAHTEPIWHLPQVNDSWEGIHEHRSSKRIIPQIYKGSKMPELSDSIRTMSSLLPITPRTSQSYSLHAGSSKPVVTGMSSVTEGLAALSPPTSHSYMEPICHPPQENDSRRIIPRTHKRSKIPELSSSTMIMSLLTPITTRTSQSHSLHAGSSKPLLTSKGSDSEGLAARLRSLKQKISKAAHFHARTGSLPSPAKQSRQLTPINVNMVVMGPQQSGVSSLIYRFINGTNGWVAPATVDDFWHHVVRSESEGRITYFNITEVTGEEGFEFLRRSMLLRAQLVVLCFRLDKEEQFKRDVKRV
jgi:hypothetical protein